MFGKRKLLDPGENHTGTNRMNDYYWIDFKEYLGKTDTGIKFLFVVKDKELEVEIPDNKVLKICWFNNQVKLSNFKIEGA